MTAYAVTNVERHNVLAIVGFVAAFVIAPVGVVLSFVALSQIKRTGERGRGLAIAGVVLGILAIIMTALSMYFWVGFTAQEGPYS